MVSGLIIKNRNPDQKPESDQEDSSIHSHAEALIAAVKADDAPGVAKALKEAFQAMDKEPHEEGPHTNESSKHTYDAQNIKAGQE